MQRGAAATKAANKLKERVSKGDVKRSSKVRSSKMRPRRRRPRQRLNT